MSFNKHSLIIRANDVGKTNRFYAMRVLLDRGLSDYDYERGDANFYAYESMLSAFGSGVWTHLLKPKSI